MRKLLLSLLILSMPAYSGCSLNWLFNLMFDNPHAGGNGSAADRQRTAQWEAEAMSDFDHDNHR